MKTQIEELLNHIKAIAPNSKEQVEELRIALLGKKGKITELFEEFKTIVPEQRKEMGQLLNTLKNKAQEKISELKDQFENKNETTGQPTDLTLPAENINIGSRHPLSIIRNQIVEIFSRIGFTVSDGPEIEDDWHNFTALNTPADHPARDMQDTFYISVFHNVYLHR